ncbi:MAG: hypothetical protein P4L51_05965 [Puia sp.]|nr:hypothetical protein [Puia sp.]
MVACRGPVHKDKSTRIERLLQQGFQSDAREDDSSSLKIYDSILQEDPDNYISLVNRGRAKIEVGDTVSGMADLAKSIKIHPTPEAFISKAIVELNNDPKQALKDLKTGNEIRPDYGLITGLLAQYYSSIEPLRDSALHYADHTCHISSKTLMPYLAAMNAYLYFNDYPNLLKATDTIIARLPNSGYQYPAYPYNNRGLAELMLGEIQKAKQDIRTSLNLDSNNAWAYRNMSLLFNKMNKSDSSCYYIRLARQKDKTQQYKKDIDSLILSFCGKLQPQTHPKPAKFSTVPKIISMIFIISFSRCWHY